MNCKECGTWNPDDKRVCWKCQAELPKPVETRKKQTTMLFGLPIWTWVVLVAMVAILFLGQCIAGVPGGGG